MMGSELIPAVDAFPIPAPEWLFHTLLVFTFFLHLLFMNLTLGGTLLAAVSHHLGGKRKDDPRTVIAQRLMGVNNIGISLTITTGVAPLLFVQVLFQQYFYTATILIAWVWLLLLVVLMVGYYAAYGYKFKGTPAGTPGGGLWLWISALCFFVIAMVQVAVNLIHAQPGKWAMLAENPWAILGDSTYLVRLLHFLLAAIAASGVLMAWWAARKAKAGVEVELNTAVARYGWKWALWSTLIAVVDGFLLLFVLPREVLLSFMRGGAATMVPLVLAIVLAVGLLMMLAKVSNPVESLGTVTGTLYGLVATIAVMAVTRHQVRSLYLAPYSEQFSLEVASQWGNFVLFAVLLVLGLATVYYMVRRVLDTPAEGEEAA
jgi:hypothetical protein